MDSSDDSSCEEVDFNVYRKIYESDEHWELRKAFMETHWDNFTEQEILCLAQVFVNVEFLGCKYPAETMTQVAQLASTVTEIQRYRAVRRNRLKRTFVGAQDAVQAKLQKSDAPRRLENAPRASENWTKDEKKAGFKVDLVDWTEKERSDIDLMIAVNSSNGPIIRFSESQKSDNLSSLLKDIIYFEVPGVDLNGSLNKTVSVMQKAGKLEMKYDADERKYFYIFNSQIVGEGAGESKKIAKKLADDDLVATLKANCYTIKNKVEFYSPEDVIKPKNQSTEAQASTNKLQEDNVGFKMLKLLGWSGGSLGTKNNGIVDPVNLEIKIGRKGLGADDNEKFDEKYIRNLLKNFKNNQVEYDLVFSHEFTKEERAQIHQIAQQNNLKTKSFGRGMSRHIVISTKLSPQVLRQKLIEGDQHLLEKYELIPPPPKPTLKKKK